MTDQWPDYDDVPAEDRPRDPGGRPRAPGLTALYKRIGGAGLTSHEHVALVGSRPHPPGKFILTVSVYAEPVVGDGVKR